MHDRPGDHPSARTPDATMALIEVARAAYRLRQLGRQGAPPTIMQLIADELSAALDELERRDPGLFAAFAFEDQVLLDEYRGGRAEEGDAEGFSGPV